MRARRGSERIGVLDAKLELAREHACEDALRPLREILARRDVMYDRWARREQRTLGIEHLEIEWRHGAARSAEEDEISTRPQHVEALLPRRLADRIVHDAHACAARYLTRFYREIIAVVANDMIGAGAFGELGFRICRDGRDDRCALRLGELREQQTDAAGARMDERRFTRCKRIGAIDEIVRGHALEHERGGIMR